MPTYEYVCTACGLEFEAFQSIKDAPLTSCSCGKSGTVNRKIGRGAGIIFKGSGFYETDYKRKSSVNSTGSDSGGSTNAPKADTKPASPPSAPPSST